MNNSKTVFSTRNDPPNKMTSAPKWYPSPLLDYEARGSNPTFQPLASVKNIVYFCDAKSLETVDAVSFQPTASILFAKHGTP